MEKNALTTILCALQIFAWTMRIFVQNALLMTIVKIKALTSVTHQQVNAKRKLENLVILVLKKENVIMI